MALNPETEFSGQITASNSAYPYGSAKDVTAPGANDGTPFSKRLLDDIFGWQQALLDAGAVTPSGDPDEVGASDYLTALDAIIAASILARETALYPVGEILITGRTGNPNTWLGFGTWVAHAEGKALFGVDTGDSDFNTVGETGGSKSIPRDGWGETQTSEVMPSPTTSGRLVTGSGNAEVSEGFESLGHASADRSHLPPYVTVFVWKRTA